MIRSTHLSTHPSENLYRRCGVGFFSSLSDAEYAVTSLRSVSFPLHQITLIAHHFRRQDQFAEVNLCDRLENANLELPALQLRFYREQLSCNQYMMIVEGTEDELNQAASILNPCKIQGWQLHRLTAANSAANSESSG
jgi:hypothetical protein